MKNRVVPFPPSHTHIQGDGMEYKDGNCTVRINVSYAQNKTPEQEKADRERLGETLYTVVEILMQQGEAV